MGRPVLARLLVVVVLGAVVALSVAAVRSTDALWSDRNTTAPGTVNTGQLKLVAGTGTNSTYQFAGLTGAGIAVLPGTQSQAPLMITNAGSTPLRYRLTAGGPQVTSGSGVTLTLSGTVMAIGATCGAGALPGVVAFTAFDASDSAAAPTPVSSWRSLAKGVTETWCIRSTLKSVVGSSNQSATYTVLFTFGSEQTRS
jgi:hypothetical protein